MIAPRPSQIMAILSSSTSWFRHDRKRTQVYRLLTIFLITPSSPTRPIPNKRNVDGSGTAGAGVSVGRGGTVGIGVSTGLSASVNSY